jgi:internalin A
MSVYFSPKTMIENEEVLKIIEQARTEKKRFLSLSKTWIESIPAEVGQLEELFVLEIHQGWRLTEIPPEIGNLKKLQRLSIRGNWQLQCLPPQLGELKQLHRLDIVGNSKLSVLPKEIGQLSNLVSLDLSGNRNLSELPSEIGQLTNLRELNLDEAIKIQYLPEEIGALVNLNILSFNYSRGLLDLPITVNELVNLHSLSLSQNPFISQFFHKILQITSLRKLEVDQSPGLTKLPEEIKNLANLEHLRLSKHPDLESIPSEIGCLNSLTTLEVYGNRKLAQLPNQIGELSNLSSLNLSDNLSLKRLPSGIGKLGNLTRLDLSGNKNLTNFPSEFVLLKKLCSLNLSRSMNLMSQLDMLTQLPRLAALDLSQNQLSSFPAVVTEFSGLKSLRLNQNQLRNIPPEISGLINLQSLELRGNRLQTLPPELGELELRRLTFGYNPFPNLPPEIRRKGWRAIVRFYQQFGTESDYLYEAKLLIVGEPGAGKTTLANKIQDPNYQLQPDQTSTDGVEIIRYSFPFKNEKNFRVNIWDFGGQQIYHETHQFFLTKRSLYILVADTRKEDTDFYYWLNIVKLLSDNSPLLIVKNEKQNIKLVINERELRGDFENFRESYAVNLADNRGLEDLLKEIRHYITNLSHVGDSLPKSWVEVRRTLEQDSRNYITLDEYLRICENKGFRELEDKLLLSGYLHDLGVFLHFQEDDLLNKTIVLKPTWGTDAVYKVLRNSQVTQNLGKFNREDLENIWSEEKYSNMRPELLRLMMNFKLCYEIPSNRGNYIAPQLLSPEKPEYEWNEFKNLFLRYEYEFMPKGILTRFIVEMHPWIEEEILVWKTGVILQKDGARAEVIERYRYHKGEIWIRISGNRKRDLLACIRHEFDKIHQSYEYEDESENIIQRLNYKTLVPCNCENCGGSSAPYFYSLERLHKFVDKGKLSIQCYESGDDVSVYNLIDDILPDFQSSSKKIGKSNSGQCDIFSDELNIRQEKVKRLREDLAIAAGTAQKFELEKQIEIEESKIKELEGSIQRY